jgi:hypothetical protein
MINFGRCGSDKLEICPTRGWGTGIKLARKDVYARGKELPIRAENLHAVFMEWNDPQSYDLKAFDTVSKVCDVLDRSWIKTITSP